MKLLLGILVLVTWLTASAAGLTLMSYNVQNLFDDVDNGSEFREFNPSRGGWNSEMFHLRVGTIAEVVRAAVPGRAGRAPAAGDRERERAAYPCG